ncbi:MAG TPA: pyridoxal-phosphate dependent enzyme [Anaerolineae bacterium]|jgi:cysteine synthase
MAKSSSQTAAKSRILGPTFEEMLHPQAADAAIRARADKARTADPLDPINLFNITWRKPDGAINYFVMPHELTGVDAEIIVMVAKDFPTGSHKVGPAYSCMIEKYVDGELDPEKHTLVFPSTGNYGIGGAWVGRRAGFDTVVILPQGMSKERFEKIDSYGARAIKTTGSESNVKEIYDECNRLTREHPDTIRILNQFAEMGNYRFHYHVTGNTIVELEQELAERLGTRGIAAYCSSMGSAGTIAAGDRLKQSFPDCRVIGLEPIQCPTLFNNGYGSHDIQGIGDKHVTWIHHVTNMDGLACIDDQESVKLCQVLTDPVGGNVMMKRFGVPSEMAAAMAGIFGISGACNLIGAIKTARHYALGKRDAIVIPATDNIERYHSTMRETDERYGRLDECESLVRIDGILHHQKTDWYMDGTPGNRRQWHNLKYYTWVEQQGKSVDELNAQLDPEWWLHQQAKVADTDRKILALRA